MTTTEKNAETIRRAYGSRHHKGETMTITELTDSVDLTSEQLTDAITHLYRTDARFDAIPNAIQGDLTAADRANAIIIGRQAKHLIIWH